MCTLQHIAYLEYDLPCAAPGETTPSEAYSLADLVHEEAHPVVSNPRQAVLKCIQARYIDCPLIQHVPSFPPVLFFPYSPLSPSFLYPHPSAGHGYEFWRSLSQTAFSAVGAKMCCW